MPTCKRGDVRLTFCLESAELAFVRNFRARRRDASHISSNQSESCCDGVQLSRIELPPTRAGAAHRDTRINGGVVALPICRAAVTRPHASGWKGRKRGSDFHSYGLLVEDRSISAWHKKAKSEHVFPCPNFVSRAASTAIHCSLRSILSSSMGNGFHGPWC